MKSGKSYLGAGVPSILLTLVILLISCFAALTFISANSEMKLCEKSAAYCDDYYHAETVAAEILSAVAENNFDEKFDKIADKNDSLIYNDVTGDIVINRGGNDVSFIVPINKKQGLNVAAQITNGQIDIVKWSVE